VVLRPATLRDADAGAALHLTCWREAYGPLVDRDLLEAQLADPESWAARWRERIALGAPRMVAAHGAELVGFASVGAARYEGAPGGSELYAIYVLAAWHGTGVGQALLDVSLGGRSAYLWVLEDNLRARHFYERNGFRWRGARKKFEPLDAWERCLVR
jgi:ribosomal protein S18 acetylase RimI-like enzyme